MALNKQEQDKLQQQLNQLVGEPTRQDYNKMASLNNWATARPGSTYMGEQYTGWDGGSIRSADGLAAGADAGQYNYDVALDPRSNTGVQQAISALLLNAQEKANQNAIAGNGTYDDNLNQLYQQIGWNGYQTVFDNLQKNKTLGLTDLNGVALEKSAGLGNPNWSYDPSYDIGSPEWQARIDRQNEAEAAYLATLPGQNESGIYDGDVSGFSNGRTVGQGVYAPGVSRGNSWSGYDYQNDPVYKAYEDRYTRAGQQALSDSTAKAAARTGGMASSYAQQVGNQQYNEYMRQLSDIIPQLEQQDYSRWKDEQQLDLQRQQLAMQQQAQDFSQQQARQQAAAQAAATAKKNQEDAFDQLISLHAKYGYEPTAEEAAAAGMNGNMLDAILGRGDYAPEQAVYTGPGAVPNETPAPSLREYKGKLIPDNFQGGYAYEPMSDAEFFTSPEAQNIIAMANSKDVSAAQRISDLLNANYINDSQAETLLNAVEKMLKNK